MASLHFSAHHGHVKSKVLELLRKFIFDRLQSLIFGVKPRALMSFQRWKNYFVLLCQPPFLLPPHQLLLQVRCVRTGSSEFKRVSVTRCSANSLSRLPLQSQVRGQRCGGWGKSWHRGRGCQIWDEAAFTLNPRPSTTSQTKRLSFNMLTPAEKKELILSSSLMFSEL